MISDKHRNELDLQTGLTYLNHAAVAPWPRRTVKAVQQFAAENGATGPLHYERWLRAEQQLRGQLKTLINARSTQEIALLKNTSEALSVIAYGLPWQRGDNIVSIAQEFPSNRIVWESLKSQGVALKLVDTSTSDNPEQALIEATDSRTRLLSVSSVQYASGLRLDLQRLGQHCRSHGTLLCVDAIQSLGALPFDVEEIEADFVVADGHKWMLGPEGVALFYCHKEAREQLQLRQFGWHMVEKAGNYTTTEWQVADSARRFECGSPNMLGIHALSASLSLLLEIGIDAVAAQILDSAAYLIKRIQAEPQLQLLSADQAGRFGGIVTFRHNAIDSASLHKQLMSRGIACAARGGGIRFSPHFYNSREELDRALNKVLHCC